MMREITFFDANACLGRSACRTPGAPYDSGGLLRELDHCRISRALVYHASARELDPALGNKMLFEEADNNSRLVPAGVLSPALYSASGPPVVKKAKELLERGARAFRIFPLYHQFPLDDSRLLEALDLLQKREVPLFIDFDQPYYNLKQLGQHEQRAIDLPAVRHLAEKFPGLPVVVVGANYNHTGKIFELFDRVENLKAELSLFQGFEVLAFICRTWGPERLLFGTGLPAISPGAARAAVMYADIGEDDRRKIASANLEALLGEPPAPALDEDPERSGLLQEIDRGRRIESIEVIDLHGHIAPVGFESVMGLTLGPQDAGSMVRVMDRIGIQAVAVSSWEVAGGNAPAGNRLAWEAVEKHPGRFLPYMVVNANFPEDWPAESAECFDRKRFFGLKPYPFFQRCPLSGPAYKKSLCLADRLGLPVLCHPGFDPLSGLSPGELEVLAPRYPGAIFLVAHAGASFRLADAFCDLALAFDNVLLEINYTSVPFGMISYLTGKVGAGRVIFGTDMPMRDPAPIIGWVAYDHLTDEERRSILGLNARALIEKTGYPGPVGRP